MVVVVGMSHWVFCIKPRIGIEGTELVGLEKRVVAYEHRTIIL